MGVMGTAIGSALLGTYSQNQSLIAQGQANVQTARNLITSMNYSLQNYEQERTDAFEATIAELEKIKLQGNRQVTSVSASVNEGLMGGGRTADMIKRSSQADVNRTVAAAKTNYEKKSNEIDLNKEATLLNTRQQLASIKDVQKPSFLSTLLSIGTNYLQAKGTLESIDAIKTKAGVKDIRGNTAWEFKKIDTTLYGVPQKAFDDIYGTNFVNDPSVNFSLTANPSIHIANNVALSPILTSTGRPLSYYEF